MIQTLNKHVRWRKDNGAVFICDCKRLIDLKIPLKYEFFMKKLERGLEKEKLNEEEKKIFSDFEKIKLLSDLKVREIKPEEFNNAIKILNQELGERRVRSREFLSEKFKKYPEFFIGAFLNNELIGIIGGFPREDYLLISEIVVDSKFQNRGIGKKLVEHFENIAKEKKHKKIHVGAEDEAIKFYQSLSKYEPFLLIQFKSKDYSYSDFSHFNIIKKYNFDEYLTIEAEVKKVNLKILEKLRKKYSKAWFQYIFTKKLN